jgi:hypothetical protein
MQEKLPPLVAESTSHEVSAGSREVIKRRGTELAPFSNKAYGINTANTATRLAARNAFHCMSAAKKMGKIGSDVLKFKSDKVGSLKIFYGKSNQSGSRQPADSPAPQAGPQCPLLPSPMSDYEKLPSRLPHFD